MFDEVACGIHLFFLKNKEFINNVVKIREENKTNILESLCIVIKRSSN
jgi:hypothetical protein